MRYTWVILAGIVFLFSPQVTPLTRVTLYENSNYGGKTSLLNDLDTVSYYFLSFFNDKTTSFKINYGSCVEMHMNNPPGYLSNAWFWTTTLNYGNVGSQWNDRISSVKGCGTYPKTIHCPTGTFVKKVEWSSGLQQGVTIRCYKPESITPTSSLRTHGSGSMVDSKECTGVRGIAYDRDTQRQADVGLTPVCRAESSGPHKIMCTGNKAVSGMAVTIENRSGYIKSSSLYCSDVGDIEAICRAHDKRTSLFICDATQAVLPLKCSWAKMVGYGKKASLSETETREYNFYSEYGFDMGAAGYGLGLNFKGTLGTSNTTGYSWTTTQESTWDEQITISVEAEAPPGCVTTVYEIVGECSFIAVRPSYFQRNDTCNRTSILTNVHIPLDFDTTKVFYSQIPRIVLNFMTSGSLENTVYLSGEVDEPIGVNGGEPIFGESSTYGESQWDYFLTPS